MASVPAPFTLSISVGDKMNLKGQLYGITAVAAGVDDGKGNTSYAVTLNDPNTTIVTVSAKDTISQSQTGAAGGTGATTWFQSKNA